jgi:Spy/CpxP family protein refolding chaperone
MRMRTLLLAASVAALPALAMAQTAPPAVATPPAATAAPDKEHHERGEHRKEHAEMHAKYEKLSAADKAKFDELSKQVKQLRQQQRQILGMSKS